MDFSANKLRSLVKKWQSLIEAHIQRKMAEIIINESQSCDLKELVLKFIPEVIGKEIEKVTSSIFPLQNVYIRKVMILMAPKFDLDKLMAIHGDYSEDVG
ncbi:hypothetical protein ACS0TY_022158 [Phlomoides rotata]